MMRETRAINLILVIAGAVLLFSLASQRSTRVVSTITRNEAVKPGDPKPNPAPTYCLRTSTIEHVSPALMRHLTTEAVETLAATPLYLCPGDMGPSYNLRGFIVAGPSISAEAADHEALHALDHAPRGVRSIYLEGAPAEVEAWAHAMHPANWSDAEMWPYLAAWYAYDPRAMPPEIAAAVAHILE